MENRMFNVISFLSFIILLIVTVTNFLLGFHTIGTWTLVVSIIMGAIHYFARNKLRFKTVSYIFAILSYFAMGTAFVLNSGMNGPIVYGFLLTFLIIIIITPPRTHLIWFFLHSFVVVGLFVLEAERPDLFVYQYETVYDQVLDLSLTYVPVLLFIYVSGIYVRSSYIFEKRLADQRLKTIKSKNQELEFINNEKDRLFSIIGHDLRSPLNSIQGFLEVINDPILEDNEREEIQKELYALTTNTTQLLTNLLLWSSKQGKKIDLTPIKLKEAAESTTALVQAQATKKHINIGCLESLENVVVIADNDMLQVVLRNIISNAIKFTPENGTVELFFTEKDNKVTLCIKDNGIGIPAEKQEDIFTSKTKSSFGTAQETGVGLGLVLCHDFMQAMGGEISFTSHQGEGSTFMLTLKKATD